MHIKWRFKFSALPQRWTALAHPCASRHSCIQAHHQRHRAGACRPASETGLLDQVAGDPTIDDAEHLAPDPWTAGEQQTQGIRKAQHPLAHRLLGKHRIAPQGRALGHAPRPAAGAKAARLAAERHRVLGMAGVAAHPQKALLQAAATQVVFEFLLHIVRHGALLLGHVGDERRVVLLDDLVEESPLGPVALVRGCAPVPLGTRFCERA